MKLLALFRQFRKGIQLPMLVLIVIMTVSIWGCVSLYGEINYIISDLLNFGDNTSHNTSYVQALGKDLLKYNTDKKSNLSKVLADAVAQDDRVEAVLPILTLPRAKFQGKSVEFIIYSTEMTKYMEGLTRSGVQFSGNPDGCIVSGKVFRGYQPGDNVGIFVGETTIDIPVVGRLKKPYRYIDYTKYSNVLNVSALYAGDEAENVVIMQATDNVMNNIVSQAGRIDYRMHFVVVFKKGVSLQEQKQIIAELAPPYDVFPFDKVIENSKEQTYDRLKEAVPFPLFMLGASLLAYLSVSFLIFKRKESEIAVFYLNGGSRFRCSLIMFFTYSLVSLIPVTLNVLVVYFWPRPWSRLLDDLTIYMTKVGWNREIWSGYFFDMSNATYKLNLDTGAYFVIFAFYGLTVLIAILTTFFAMRKHSPLTYLRGVNE